jgi:5-oxoprolinase (ATP-hydrolysing) subunit A
MKIDLNSDLGEGFGPWAMGDDAAMLDLVSSANIACGGHAGDPETMFKTVSDAKKRNVVIGAHPGYADREGFGRRIIPMAPAEIGRMIAAQLGALVGVSSLADIRVRYVKPHGALANLAADDRNVAQSIVSAVSSFDPRLAILAISGTELELVAREAGVDVYSEIFADRAYLPNGRLVPRSWTGAVVHDARKAGERLLRYLETGMMPTLDGQPIKLAAQSICVHGDTHGAVEMAATIRNMLDKAGATIAPFLPNE